MPSCLIFDSDGTLVESESINMRAMSDELVRYNIKERAECLLDNYRGWRLKQVIEDVSNRHNAKLDAGFEQSFRARASIYFDRELQPVENIQGALERLPHDKCVASNAPMEKLHQVLKKTNLLKFFNNNLFSAYDLSLFKPDPGLFLHAAHSMGRGPDHCIVIEDSVVGVQAAIAANMKCVFYNPHSALLVPQNSDAVLIQINNMAELPRVVKSLEVGNAAN